MAVIYVLSMIYKNDEIDSVKITYLYAFIGIAIGLIALIIDIVSYFIPWEYLMFIHPICGVNYGIFLVFFIHKQLGIKKSKAIVVTILSLVAFFSFRMLFIK